MFNVLKGIKDKVSAPHKVVSSPFGREEIVEMIKKTRWYHGWEIVPGVHTGGACAFDPAHYFDVLGVPKNLSGRTALDIGCYDGILTFELEKRGARVIATDIQDPGRTGFSTAKKVLGSQVEYIRCSVYDLSKHITQKVDLVLFCGVFYHLKYPIMAFEEIGKITHDHSQLYLEGECLLHYAETLKQQGVDCEEIERFAEIPLAAIYPGTYIGANNWCVPNVACIKSWLQTGGFALNNHSFISDKGKRTQRIFGFAVKDRSLLEHATLESGGLIVEHGLI